MRYLLLILFVMGLFSVSSWLEAQDQKQKKKAVTPQERYLSLRDKLFQDMQIFEKTFQNDTDFLELEKEIQRLWQEQMELHNSLRPRGFGNAFGPDFFDQDQSVASDEFEWSETDKNRLLKIKIKMPSDQPLDIKIAKNMVTVSGKIKTANQTSQFVRSVSVPSDCDASKAQIQTDKDGFAVVSFPKHFPSKVSEPPRKMPKGIEPEERQPVPSTDQGIAI